MIFSSYSKRAEPIQSNDDRYSPPKSLSQKIVGGYRTNEVYVYVRGRGRGRYVCDRCGIRCKKPSMLKKHIRYVSKYNIIWILSQLDGNLMQLRYSFIFCLRRNWNQHVRLFFGVVTEKKDFAVTLSSCCWRYNKYAKNGIYHKTRTKKKKKHKFHMLRKTQMSLRACIASYLAPVFSAGFCMFQP